MRGLHRQSSVTAGSFRTAAFHDPVVSGGVVGDQPEERNQRHGFAPRVGLEKLQDSLDDAA